MAYKDRDTLFLFLDESGNLDFSEKGSRYWALTAFCTFHPSHGKEGFLDLFYSLVDAGRGLQCFHATEDKQAVRDEFFRLIGELTHSFEIHSVIAEKCKASPSLYNVIKMRRGKLCYEKDESRFYGVVCKALLRYVFRCPRFKHAKKIVVVLSSIWTNQRHESIRKALSLELKHQASVPFEIYFHANREDLNCQIADYCGWAIARKWERGDRRSYDLIRTKIKNEFDVFERGTIRHY